MCPVLSCATATTHRSVDTKSNVYPVYLDALFRSAPTPNPEQSALETFTIQHPPLFSTGEFPNQNYHIAWTMANRCRLLRRICFLRRRGASSEKKSPGANDDPARSSKARRRSRLAARPKSPCPQVLRKQQRKGSKKRVAVAVWKRVTRVLRRESKRGVPAGFALIIPHPRRKSRCDPESAETTTVAVTCSAPGSDWSLV